MSLCEEQRPVRLERNDRNHLPAPPDSVIYCWLKQSHLENSLIYGEIRDVVDLKYVEKQLLLQ